MAEDYKKAVLDRLEDAVALYEKKRYVASLYMSGYVIEIGIKVEFKRLSNIPFSQVEGRLEQIVKILSDVSMPNFTTLLDFMKYASDVSGNFLGKQKLDNRNVYKAIVTQKYDPPSGSDNKLHDINGFLQELKKWKETIGENEGDFETEHYDIKTKCGWETNLRYGSETQTNNSEEKDAKNALKMAIKFLKKVVYLSLNEEEMNKVIHCETTFQTLFENNSHSNTI